MLCNSPVPIVSIYDIQDVNNQANLGLSHDNTIIHRKT